LVPISRAVLQSTWGRIFTADRQRVAAGARGRGGGGACRECKQRTKPSISWSWVCLCIFSACCASARAVCRSFTSAAAASAWRTTQDIDASRVTSTGVRGTQISVTEWLSTTCSTGQSHHPCLMMWAPSESAACLSGCLDSPQSHAHDPQSRPPGDHPREAKNRSDGRPIQDCP
jgi:hypothetical protein